MTRKVTKICPVCGREFKGTEGRITCSNACRTAISRMLAKGKKPEYWLMAKSKGQKLPLVFNGPKPKKILLEEEKLDSKIEFITPLRESYDGASINSCLVDEMGLIDSVKELTWEKKLAFNADIDQQISEEKNKKHQTGMHPRIFKLQQEEKIAELEKRKIKI